MIPSPATMSPIVKIRPLAESAWTSAYPTEPVVSTVMYMESRTGHPSRIMYPSVPAATTPPRASSTPQIRRLSAPMAGRRANSLSWGPAGAKGAAAEGRVGVAEGGGPVGGTEGPNERGVFGQEVLPFAPDLVEPREWAASPFLKRPVSLVQPGPAISAAALDSAPRLRPVGGLEDGPARETVLRPQPLTR